MKSPVAAPGLIVNPNPVGGFEVMGVFVPLSAHPAVQNPCSGSVVKVEACAGPANTHVTDSAANAMPRARPCRLRAALSGEPGD